MEINNIARPDPKVSQESKTAEASIGQNNNMTKEAKPSLGTEASKSKSDYSAISKDGDTLQISDKSNNKSSEGKVVLNEDNKPQVSAAKMTDAALAKCSSSRLKQLFSQGEITRQQYDKAMKKLQQ